MYVRERGCVRMRKRVCMREREREGEEEEERDGGWDTVIPDRTEVPRLYENSYPPRTPKRI